MRSGYELFSIGSVAVKIHGSFILLGALMVLLAFSYGGTGLDVGMRLLGPLVLFATVIFHELGHAAVARKLGVRVIDVLLTPLGGVARIEGELRDPKEEGLIAVAGPAMNMILAGITYLVISALGRTGEIEVDGIVHFLEERRSFLQADLLIIFFGLNVLLAVLNLIPAFPCDGGRVLRAILSARNGRLVGTRMACKFGLIFSFSLIFMPFFIDSPQEWILPFAGIYFVFASLKERLSVEAREGLGLSGKFFQFGQTGFPGGDAFNQQQTADTQEELRRPTESLGDDNVIDVTGTSRVLDEPDE